MENNQNKPTITAREIRDTCLSLFENEISWQAKMGMRVYTTKERETYEKILFLLKLLETEMGIDIKRDFGPWDLYGPTKHRTIDALKPFDSSGDETEVFNDVWLRILKNEGSGDDEDFIKEVEKRFGGPLPVDSELEKLIEGLKNAKKELRGIELKTENELAKIQIEYKARIKALNKMQEKTLKIAEKREKNKKKSFLSYLLGK